MAFECNGKAFIKVYRKFLEWEWYSDNNTKLLFIHCLLRANWKPTKWKGVNIDAGQFVTSLANLADETQLSVRQVRTALDHLISTGEVTSKSQSKYRIITVNNWSRYQGDDKQVDKQMTSKRQADDKQATTDKEYKEYKEREEGKNIKEKYKKENPTYFPNDETLDDAFKEFLKMRKQMKKPMGDRAIELAIKKLNDLSGGDNDKAIKIINQSIMGSWQSFYELKEDKTNKSQDLAFKWGIKK